MADTFTDNVKLVTQTTGDNAGTWGSNLNANMISVLDSVLGDTLPVALASADVNLTMTQRQNLAFLLSGVLTTNLNVTLPLNANSTAVAVGGFFVFDNETSGNFAVTVKTVAAGSTGVQVPQGVRSLLYSDSVNVWFADDVNSRLPAINGNPNGVLAGTAGGVATRASLVLDYTTNKEYLCTATGTATSARWSLNFPYPFEPQGYLTASNDPIFPYLTADSIGATSIFYTPKSGNLCFIYNGTTIVPVEFPQMTLNLSASAQAANGVYDAMMFLHPVTGVITIGFSPAWQSLTSRGIGAGTPQLALVQGLLVNAFQQQINNGALSFTVDANKATYIGTVYIDASAGQTTCHRSYGTARKFGIWNPYNQEDIVLMEGDPTASWASDGLTNYRPANGNANNKISVLCGLPQSAIELTINQFISVPASRTGICAIGWNSTTVPSGVLGRIEASGVDSTNTNPAGEFDIPESALGVNVATALESGGAVAVQFRGTQSGMQMKARWRG